MPYYQLINSNNTYLILIIIIIIIIIIMKSSIDRDNNYCHYVILRNAGFAITLHYHPAGYIPNTFLNILCMYLIRLQLENDIYFLIHLNTCMYVLV
jgi:hypothetical protein